ncbi:hypothetical protein Golax_020562, partial [Gossypium laxum]|nr:hypothetical protein [Gossypium laxum]
CELPFFEREIEEALHNIYEHDYKDDQTLEATSLRFRLLRDNGFNVQCVDMFSMFKDNEGNFKKSLISDMEGLPELYEAAIFFCAHGEDILEEALAFITTHPGLEKAASTIRYPLSASVSHAVYRPNRKSLPTLEARRFISIYGENASHDNMLLKFTELDFSLLQISHKEEWWKDLNFVTRLPFTRNRVVEYLTSITDDIYDAYGTFEELQLLTDAIANTKEIRNHKRTKHIDRKYHIIREAVADRIVDVIKVASKDNFVDPFCWDCQYAPWRSRKIIPTIFSHESMYEG